MALPFTDLGAFWEQRGAYKKTGGLLPGYPQPMVVLYAGVDKVHEAIRDLILMAQHSIIANMFGYDDDEFDAEIREKLDSEHVYCQISLDKSQSGGVHEKVILAKWKADDLANSIAIGTSQGSAISHEKMLIVDGLIGVFGSTNWSTSGESKQNNECMLVMDPVVLAEARAEMDRNHTWMLQQQAKRLTVAKAA